VAGQVQHHRYIGRVGDPRSFELLTEALTENDLVKTAAISSLGDLGDMQAIPLLVPLQPIQTGKSATELCKP